MQTNALTFAAHCDAVVIGHNAEMADYSNPRGDIIGWAASVLATDPRGERVALHIQVFPGYQDAAEAGERLAQALTARFAAGKLPVGFSQWQPTHAAYGSDAYDEQDTIEWERRMEQDAAFM